jgi:hypothetical protein
MFRPRKMLFWNFGFLENGILDLTLFSKKFLKNVLGLKKGAFESR